MIEILRDERDNGRDSVFEIGGFQIEGFIEVKIPNFDFVGATNQLKQEIGRWPLNGRYDLNVLEQPGRVDDFLPGGRAEGNILNNYFWKTLRGKEEFDLSKLKSYFQMAVNGQIIPNNPQKDSLTVAKVRPKKSMVSVHSWDESEAILGSNILEGVGMLSLEEYLCLFQYPELTSGRARYALTSTEYRFGDTTARIAVSTCKHETFVVINPGKRNYLNTDLVNVKKTI